MAIMGILSSKETVPPVSEIPGLPMLGMYHSHSGSELMPCNSLCHFHKVSQSAGNCESHLHDSDGIVVKDGWDVFRGKLVGGVTDKETRLSDSTVTDNDTSVASEVSAMSQNHVPDLAIAWL